MNTLLRFWGATIIDKEKEETPGKDSRKTMSDKEDQEKPAKEHLAHNSGSVSVPTMQRQVAFWSSHGWSLTTKRQTIFFIRKGVNYVLLFRLLRTFSLKKQNKKKTFFMLSPIRQVVPFVLLDFLVWFRHHAASSLPLLFRFWSCLLLLFNMFWIL